MDIALAIDIIGMKSIYDVFGGTNPLTVGCKKFSMITAAI
jgi:hypothetical protein